MRRRNFIQGMLVGVSTALFASLPYAVALLIAPRVRADRGTRLRPPGALANQQAFNRACIGCGLCGEVCPPRCILFHRREGGGELNLPYINPEIKGCILCGKCMQVCPTEALTALPLQDVDMGIAQIDRTACYPWVDKGVCGACVVICPLGERAISFEFANIYRPIVQQACVGCGLCVEICPHPSLPIRIAQRDKGTITRHTISSAT